MDQDKFTDASCNRKKKLYFGMLIFSIIFSKLKAFSVHLPWECTSEQLYMQQWKGSMPRI